MKLLRYLSVIGACWLGSSAAKAQVSIDGILGSEWLGVTPVNVAFNALAPTDNFGTPTNENRAIGYDIYLRADASWVYVGLQTTTNNDSAPVFANLYFDTNPGSGSDIGFEITNSRAFVPGSLGYYPASISFATAPGSVSTPSVIETAIPLSYFTTNVLVPGLPVATSAIQLRLSQSFGYSVAGGSSYGDTRLGQVAIPEPSTYALLFGACVSGVVALRRFRAKAVR